ncbi:MAG TPA: glutathione S-transferase N-terminal domain-containing protein [Alphaproteobacteria bacterium]|nr:glutathione S-transferase N-terminal domain-containing protein [Alphaproteobacteria bacterium]
MAGLVLYSFAISHYCEKVRWALDLSGLPYREACLAPGLHARIARKMAPRRSLPILRSGGTAVQGSAAVLDWLAQAHPAAALPADAAGRAIEARLDEAAGPAVRQMFYAAALTRHPDRVRQAVFHRVPLWQRLLAWPLFPAIRRALIDKLPARPADFAAARDRLDAELAWLDGLLADGRPNLSGDRFGRADLAAASLLAVVAAPPEHPVYPHLAAPAEEFAAAARAWAERPCLRHVRRLYREHRRPGALPGAA